MRDDRHRWPAAGGPDRPPLIGRDVAASLIRLPRQTVLSGPYTACMSLAAVTTPAVGGDSAATGDHYAIRQRRDRVLVVGGTAIDDGWHPDPGIAVSDMTAAYAVIELAGPGVQRVIASGTEFVAGSRSAARLWHGFSCLLYRHGDSYRLHIRSAHLDAAWQMLDRQFGLLARMPDPDHHVTSMMDSPPADIPVEVQS